MLTALAVPALIVVTGVVVDLHRLAGKRERAHRAWSQIQGLLARRRDLVPDLSHAVRGYAPQQHALLDAVAAAREEAITANATGQPVTMAAAEQHLDRAVRSLLALADTIPALATTEHYRELRANFVVLDVRIEHCVGDYSDLVEDFNSALRHAPTRMIAAVGRYRPLALYRVSAPRADALRPNGRVSDAPRGPG